MKKTIFFILFFVGFKISIQAANLYSDTIWVKLRNGILLRLVGNDFDHKFPQNMDLTNSIKSFLHSWEEIKGEEMNETKKMEISFDRKKTSNQIRTRESSTTKRVFLLAPEDSFKFSIPLSNILDINLDKTQLRLYFSDVKQIKEAKEFKTDSMLKLLKADVESSKSIYAVNRWYVFTPKDELNLVHTERSNYIQNDLVIIGLGTNIQLVRGSWAPGFSGSISIVFCRKLIQRNKYSILYDGIFDFSDNSSSQQHINHFFGIGYSRNFAATPGFKSWYGINLSYLVKNAGPIFDKNTYSLALTKNFSSYLDLQPTIFFNDFFKNIYPSIKMSVHF